MVVKKPDCTGQRFGMLTVLGEGRIIVQPSRGKRKFRHRRLWKCLCDCGNTIEIPRGNFEINGQKSCGCLGRNRKGRVDNKRRPDDITGQRFGSLVALEMLPKVRENNSAFWKCQCDCGKIVYFTCKRLRKGYRLNCGSSDHLPGSLYPPTPRKLPPQCWDTINRYLPKIRSGTYNLNNQAVEDEKMDRLIRVSWIIHFRESQGENLTDLYKRRYIGKYLRFARVAAEMKRKNSGKNIYTKDDTKNPIGIEMTSQFLTFRIEDGANGSRPEFCMSKPRKRRKFKIC